MKIIFSKVKLKMSQVVQLFALVLLSAVGQMLLPSFLAQMISHGVAEGKNRVIWIYAMIMAGVTLLSCVISFLSVKIASYISTEFAAQLRNQVFSKVQEFSAAEMDNFGTASLVTRSTSDITNVQNFLTLLLRVGLLAPMMAVAGLVFSAATGGKVSSVLLVAIPVLLIALTIIMVLASRYSIRLRKKLDQINRLFLESLEGVRVIRAFNKQKTETDRFEEANKDYAMTAMAAGRLDQINRLFLESLEGVRVIRAFNKQKTETDRFEEANKDYAMTAMAAGRVTSLLMPVISVIFGVTTAAVLGMGAYFVDTGAMEVGSLVANSQYISMVLTSVMMLSLVIMMFPTSYACAKRIAEVLETESSICDGDFSMENRPMHGTVEFRHVTFAYPGADEPILKDVSFVSNPGEVTAIIGGTGRGKSSILKLVEFRHVTFAYPGADEPILKDVSFVSNPGEVTAIIGGTGRGKSSILKLIPRLYDPMFGEVLIDGVNAKEYRTEDLREVTAIIGGTGRGKSSILKLIPRLYDPMFGEVLIDGVNAKEYRTEDLRSLIGYVPQKNVLFSGGQRQRMAIARAIASNPEIMKR